VIARAAIVIVVAGVAVLGLGPRARGQAPGTYGHGAQLYAVSCSTCHLSSGDGQPGKGVPSLHGVGAAAVDFYLSTGRMPEANLTRQAPRKPVRLSATDRAALVTYVTETWPGGPDIPPPGATYGDVATGGDLYRSNCAACHGASGAGAALAHGAYAPSLHRATPVQVVEAIRAGPGNMPIFSPGQLSDTEVGAVASYVEYLHHPRDRGGLGLGHTGPIAEGFVGLLFGLAGAVAVAAWVGHRSEPSDE
jgi:ubiquinol-cytochrome c reductase cytochrome c subunit